MSCGDGTVAPPNKKRDTDMKFLPWIVHHPRRVIALTLLLVTVAAAGLAHLQQTADYRINFNPNDPHLAAAEALQATYTRSDNVLFVIAPKTGEVFTNPILADVQALTAAAWQLPYAQRVDSVTNFQHSHAEGDTLVVDDNVHKGKVSREAACALQSGIALAE